MRSNSGFTPIFAGSDLLQGRGETELPKGSHFQISAWAAPFFGICRMAFLGVRSIPEEVGVPGAPKSRYHWGV